MNDKLSQEGKNRNYLIQIVSVIAVVYLIFSLVSPMFFPEKQQPRKIETPDLLLIALVLLFNSGLLNRLEDFGISKDGGITAKFKQLKQEVNEQKQQIDELQAQQLEQLQKQQQDLEETQAFMYNLLLGDKDCEKIEYLLQHSESETRYDFHVSNNVADQLRNLRDLNLIKLKSGYISDLVKASDNGQRSIDLTDYLYVTDFGKRFLTTRNKLKQINPQEINSKPE